MGRKDWDATVSNAVHAGISAADAICVWHLGGRPAGQDHSESQRLLYSLPFDPKENDRNAKHLSKLLEVKNAAQYEERPMGQSDAEEALTQASRFREWMKKKVP